MNYTTEKSLPEAVSKERKFTEFFRNVKAATRNQSIKDNNQKWNENDEKLSLSLQKCQVQVREALSDSFDTPRAVNDLSNLVTAANIYL